MDRERQSGRGSSAGLQPFVHDRVVTLRAPLVAISGTDGQIASGVDGVYAQDRRLLSRVVVDVPGVVVAPLSSHVAADGSARFEAILRGVGQATEDPAVTLTRRRLVGPSEMTERLIFANAGLQQVAFVVRIDLDADFCPMAEVKRGVGATTFVPRLEGGRHLWANGDATVSVSFRGPNGSFRQEPGLWEATVDLAAGAVWEAEMNVDIAAMRPQPFTGWTGPAPWPRLAVASPDRRLSALVCRSMGDLEALLLSDPASERPEDPFLAAGAPWFLTLFGRDSIWAANMLLPVSTDLAAGTLRVLARRQGRRIDAHREEAPGKIIHEVRPPEMVASSGASDLPPEYFGTIDATPLWVILLHDAWRWGLDEAEVEELLESAEAALRWMRDYGDADGDGLLEYVDSTGGGLANQGWRDSSDAIRWYSGALAAPPIALAEVQAYAYRAATAGATLLDHFGRPGADEWRTWSSSLKARFDRCFWLEGPLGAYPAVALDGDKRPVDSVTSALGHLLGTGLVEPAGEATIAAYLAAEDFDCGHGLRTLSAKSVGFNPLGYHTGSVWPHDTAIAARGLAASGHGETARSLIEGILRAAPSFDYRLPELYSGYRREEGPPIPYPAACRPQAWSAAAAVAIVTAMLGLNADCPAGRLEVDPMVGLPAPLSIRGLRVAGQPLGIAVDALGRVEVDTPAQIEVGRGDRTVSDRRTGGPDKP